jgi:Icc-related predicted phosphoesterase
MRIAATADLHFTPARFTALKDQLYKVRDEADVLVLAGDLTNFGQPSEMEPLLNAIVRLRTAWDLLEPKALSEALGVES